MRPCCRPGKLAWEAVSMAMSIAHARWDVNAGIGQNLRLIQRRSFNKVQKTKQNPNEGLSEFLARVFKA